MQSYKQICPFRGKESWSEKVFMVAVPTNMPGLITWAKLLQMKRTNQPISRFASCAQVAVSKRTSSAGWGTNGAGRFQGQVRNLQFHRPEPIISHYI